MAWIVLCGTWIPRAASILSRRIAPHLCSAYASSAAIRAVLGIPYLSHHTIRRILVMHGMVNRAGRRARRVPWVRYERKHSNSLWHTNRALLPDGRWLIAYEDGTSRLIVGYGMFANATSTNTVSVLRRAIAEHDKPASVMTNHDTQPFASEPGSRRHGVREVPSGARDTPRALRRRPPADQREERALLRGGQGEA